MHIFLKMFFILLGVALALTGGHCVGMKRLDVLAEEGSQAVLPCALLDSSYATHFPAFQWIRKRGSTESTVCRREKSGLVYRGSEVGQRSHCPSTRSGDYSLHIENVKQDDAGQYACIVQEKHRNTIITVMLRVMKVSFSPPEAMEGGSVKVACSITPEPDRLRVTWKLNGRDMEQFTPFWTNRSIHIPSVSQRHKGNWTCLVHYSKYTAQATQFLQVKGIEQPPLDKALVYAGIGSNATLPCVFTKGLTVNTTWGKLSKGSSSSSSSSYPHRDGSSPRRPFLPLPLSFTHPPLSSSSPWDQSAKLGRVEVGDEGRYRCSGKVEGRLVEREMELVTAQVLSAPSKKNTPFTLTCQLSNDKEVTEYEWVHVTYDNNSVAMVTSVEKSRTLKLPKLTQDDMGEWVCRYYGERGLLGNITYHLHLMGGLESVKAEEQSPNRGALVFGLGLLVLLVLLIALQMYRNHRRRKMILPYPALENIAHSLANERESRERRQMNEKKSNGPMEEQL